MKNTVIYGEITVFGTPGETRTHYLALRRNDYPVFLIIIVPNGIR